MAESKAHLLLIESLIPRFDDLWAFSWIFSIECNHVLVIYAREQVVSVPLLFGDPMIMTVMALVMALSSVVRVIVRHRESRNETY